MKQGFEGVPTPTEFLSKTLQEGGKVGVDPYVHSSLVLGKLQGALKAEKDISIISVTENPLDSIWADEGGREPEPDGQVRLRLLNYHHYHYYHYDYYHYDYYHYDYYHHHHHHHH